jgi:site-specific recombinase XerD
MKLLERADLVCRRRGMSGRTAQVYGQWIRRFLAFAAAAKGRWTPPEQLGSADVESFLNHLVGERHLAASTQNQALNALVFLYRHVLEDAIARDHLGKFELLRSTRPARLPTVLSAAEVARVLEAIPRQRIFRLLAQLLYGTGMRVSECCTLRVRDIDLGRAQIIVRAGKGDKDRCVMLPAALRERLGEGAVDRRAQKRAPSEEKSADCRIFRPAFSAESARRAIRAAPARAPMRNSEG